MKRFLFGLAAVAVLAMGTVSSASAQGWGGYARHGNHVDRYAGPSYGSVPNYGSFSGYGRATPYRGQYHDTTHLDYHPPTIQRHYDHFHVQPGHYDLHRSGHWHR